MSTNACDDYRIKRAIKRGTLTDKMDRNQAAQGSGTKLEPQPGRLFNTGHDVQVLHRSAARPLAQIIQRSDGA